MRLPAALLALLLALAPAAAAGGEGDPPPAPAAPGDAPKPAEDDDAALERMTGEMMRKIEEIRGLEFKQDVKRVWKTREEAKAEMLAEIEKQAEKEDLASASKAMAFFGMVREGADLKEIFADFISAAAGGYYLPDKKVFSLVRGFDESASVPIVFHELVHAVEDQHYDWQERTEKYTDADLSDHATSLHAVVEGSARMYENRYVDSVEGLRAKYMQAQMKESLKQMQAVLRAPPALVITVGMFPYGNGSLFLGEVLPALRKEKGISEVEALASIYADPPLSTEQILHPGKYLGARDLPREVRFPADGAEALGEGWKSILVDTMGEFSTGLVLNAVLKQNVLPVQVQEVMGPGESVKFKGEAATAIEGWDGDRYAIFENGDRIALGWVVAWDSPADAAEFAEAYGRVVDRKYGTGRAVPLQEKKARVPPPSAKWKSGEWSGTRWTETRGAETAVLVRGDRVLVAERVPGERMDAFLASLAKAEVVQDPKDAVPAVEKPATPAPAIPEVPAGK